MKEKNTEISARIDRLISILHTNPNKFANALGYSRAQTIYDILSGKSAPSYDFFNRFCNSGYSVFINIQWLITGSGNPIIEKTYNQSDLPIIKGEMTEEEVKKKLEIIPLTKGDVKQDISEIPLYNVNASAGLDNLFANGGELLGKISVPNMPRCDGAVHVIGDSMYPLLKSGDIIAYKIVHDLQSINYGEIYILQLDNDGDVSIVVKYLKRSEVGNDHIKLVSYNKEHDPKDIPLKWVKAIARVTFAIRQFSII